MTTGAPGSGGGGAGASGRGSVPAPPGTVADIDLRCAAVTAAAGADPVGTAGSYEGWALVPWPLPWPADLAEVEALGPVREILAGTGIRLQGIVPAAAPTTSSVEGAPLALWRRAPRGAGYVRHSHGPPAAAMEGGGAAVDPAAAGEALAAGLAALLAEPSASGQPAPREVLVCTHGRRDRCCGSLGTGLWQEIRPVAARAGAGLWRTSHTGGHRFAPTLLVLPEGTMWGFATPELVAAVLAHEGPVPLGSYRGCAALGSPGLQALERAVLGEVGWDLLERPRRGEALGGGRYRLVVHDPVDGDGPGDGSGTDAGTTVWEASVRHGRRVPVPVCGVAAAGAKVDVELVVEGLVRVGA